MKLSIKLEKLKDKQFSNNHLHVHTDASLADGGQTVKEALDAAKANGATAMAITDHGLCTNWLDFYNYAKSIGIKPILGVEAYIHDVIVVLNETISIREHLVLSAMDYIGFQAICRFVSETNRNLETVAGKPKPVGTMEMLQKFFGKGSEGYGHVICQSACIAGPLAVPFNYNFRIDHEVEKIRKRIAKTEERFPAEYANSKVLVKNAEKEIADIDAEVESLKEVAGKKYSATEKAIKKEPNEAIRNALYESLAVEKKESADAKDRINSLKACKKDIQTRIKEPKALVKKQSAKCKTIAENEEKIQALLASKKSTEDMKMEAVTVAKSYLDIFGDNFYAEVQYHEIEQEAFIYPEIAKLARELHIPIVATNDCHIAKKEDFLKRILLINAGRISIPKPTWHDAMAGDEELYVKSGKEMAEALVQILPEDIVEEAMDNIDVICSQCDVFIDPDVKHYPKFDGAKDMLRARCEKGISIRYPNGMPQSHYDQMEYELKIIDHMGYNDYFCEVMEFIDFAKHSADNSIEIGPGRGCQKENGLVYTTAGIKRIQNVRINDFAYDCTGRISRVKDTFKYFIEEEMLDISVYYGGNVTFTKDHKFLACKALKYSEKGKIDQGYRYKDNKPMNKFSWMQAKELERGDWLLFPKLQFMQKNEEIVFDLSKYCHSNKFTITNDTITWIDNLSITRSQKRFVKLDEKFAYLIGYFIADGWVRDNNSEEIDLAFNSDTENAYKDKLLSLINDCFGDVSTGVSYHTTKKVATIGVYNKALALFFKSFVNSYAKNKNIPEVFFSCNDKILINLLQGLYDGDGSYSAPGRIKYSTINPDLAYNIKRILLHLGIPAIVRTFNRKNKVNNNCNEIIVSSPVTDQTKAVFPNAIVSKKCNNLSYYCDDNNIYMRINSISTIQYKGYVYDLSVDTTNEPSYCTDVCAVHNSGAGSIVCYLTGITELDPMGYNLMFERFLNPDRVSMPDIDTDFSKHAREISIKHVKEKYGERSVASIMTKGRMAAKSAVNYAAKLFALQTTGSKTTYISIASEIASLFGSEPNVALANYNEMIKSTFANNEIALKILEYANMIEGYITSYGTHAAGVIIGDGTDVENYIPLMASEDEDGNPVFAVQADMTQCEAQLGFIKMDFLGLKNLNILTDAMRLVTKDYGIKIDPYKIPFEAEVFKEIYAKGDTNFVFQFESGGMKQMLKDFKPDCFEDIILLVAAYRPGPMRFLTGEDGAINIIDVKNGKTPLTYVVPELEPILKATYGAIIYQEQIINIVKDLAGYTMAQADNIRRAMSKKKQYVIDAERTSFVNGDPERNIPGCVANGIPEDKANAIYDLMVDFAKYAFNKAHAAAYALVSYQTAWFKYHYFDEYICAAITTQSDKTAQLKEDCDARNKTIYRPDINESDINFIPYKEGIIYGLSSIKGMKASAQVVVEERKNGVFTSPENFAKRVKIKSNDMNALVLSGAFDTFTNNRESLASYVQQYAGLINDLSTQEAKLVELQTKVTSSEKEENARQRAITTAKDKIKMMQAELKASHITSKFSLPVQTRLAYESEYLGMWITGNPMEDYDVSNKKYKLISDIETDGTYLIAGVITGFTLLHRKSDGADMCKFNFIDKNGSTINACCFVAKFAEFRHLIDNGKVVAIKGKCQFKDETLEITVCEVTRLTAQDKILTIVSKDFCETADKILPLILGNIQDEGFICKIYDKTFKELSTVNGRVDPGVMDRFEIAGIDYLCE